MHNEHEIKSLKAVAKVVTAILIALTLCAIINLCSGCKAREITIEKPIIVEHTSESHKVDIVRDTLITRDSVYHYVNGDTIRIERWHYLQAVNNTLVADTIRDTIPKVVTVTKSEIKQVNVLHWWQKALMWVGALALFLLALYMAIRKLNG